MLQGPPGRVAALNDGNEFLVLQHIDIEKRNRKNKAQLAAGIMLLVITLAIFSNLGIATEHGDRLSLDGADRVLDPG